MTKFSISISEACSRWGIGRTRLYELLKEGALKAVKCGGRTLIIVESRKWR